VTTPRSGRYLPTRLTLDRTAFVAPGAVLVGEVTLGERSSVWFGCVVRGDMESIVIGARTNIQDGTVVHVDEGAPTSIGDQVTVGHRAVIHGCEVQDDCLIGMGAVVLSGAVIGAGSLVAAGAVVLEGDRIAPGSIVAGIPGRAIGEVSEAMARRIREGADHYVDYAEGYRSGMLGGGPHGGRSGNAPRV
jgi:carbonic anhydrase/acetyltransferase-like protein (isoleucine patch superfamily)